ncbi:hypothetical protein [Nocardia abscessus]|uniref:hypothetical protein n=1 Tax=Nocardia abscessus TaxID=120957 RepID=UPI002456A2C7|nr:hypothetical protein [Nocardia abscessus]
MAEQPGIADPASEKFRTRRQRARYISISVDAQSSAACGGVSGPAVNSGSRVGVTSPTARWSHHRRWLLSTLIPFRVDHLITAEQFEEAAVQHIHHHWVRRL